MGFSIDFEFLGKPATIHVDTIDELQQLMGYGAGVKTRVTTTKRAAKYREPKNRGNNAPTRKNSKPAGKTKANGSRGWGPDVYELAKARNISAGQARSVIAKQKKKSGDEETSRRLIRGAGAGPSKQEPSCPVSRTGFET